MKITFKITKLLLDAIKVDLARRHPFAHERVGFIGAGVSASNEKLCVLACGYRPVADEDYLRDPSVGAMMGPEAIRKALQWAMVARIGVFHVHSHGGHGQPDFSGVDLREQAKFVPNFFQFAAQRPHGALVLSNNSAYGHIWLSENRQCQVIDAFVQVGAPLLSWQTS